MTESNDYEKIASDNLNRHIANVGALLAEFSEELRRRGRVHDRSKFSDEEFPALVSITKMTVEEGKTDFGTPEYKRRYELLGPMLDHHFKHNSHHPEHFPNGVDGMDLLDLVEMFFDWKDASTRGNVSVMQITKACQRFNINDQLKQILMNSAKNRGYAYE